VVVEIVLVPMARLPSRLPQRAADGYTLTMIFLQHSVNVTLQSHQPYDLTRDLVPITQATVQRMSWW